MLGMDWLGVSSGPAMLPLIAGVWLALALWLITWPVRIVVGWLHGLFVLPRDV